MKIGFEGEELSETIENYIIDGNNIIINYLDGSTNQLEYTEENEKKLINEMINQAIRRNNTIKSDDLKDGQSIYLTSLIIDIIAVILDARVFVDTDVNAVLRIITFVLATLCSFYANFNLKELVTTRKVIDELSKYETFLSIRDKLLKYKDAEGLYDGINLRSDDININTIDLYSAKELEKLKNNLLGIKERQI